jgi:hypothetical protein
MISAKADPSPSQAKTLDCVHTCTPSLHGKVVLDLPNNDMHVTPGGSVVYCSRGESVTDAAVEQSPRQEDSGSHSNPIQQGPLSEDHLPCNGKQLQLKEC